MACNGYFFVEINSRWYKKKELESTFIEIINPNNKNIIVGCYRHPCINPSEFNDVYLHELLQNVGNDSKHIILMGDFNSGMFKHDRNKDSTTFLDNVLPYLAAPSRITSQSRTLLGNIFSNTVDNEISLGNIMSTISDLCSILPSKKKYISKK